MSSHYSSDNNKRSLNYSKHEYVVIREIDTAAELATSSDKPLDPTEAHRLRRKIDCHILPLMCLLYWVQYMDKSTLGSSSVLGITKATHLSTNEYNWLGTVFYLSYLVFEYPQNLALQRFPVGKWMSINILIWGIALMCHAAAKSFAGLLICRMFLGTCEAAVTPGFLIATAMFYTRSEQILRVGYWYLMSGTAQITSGLLSYGILHIKTKRFEPWQWLMIITGVITILTAICYFFLFPDSPTNAWFLTSEERVMAVKRIKENQTGIENKHFKKEQMIEALFDSKTWLFALAAVLISNSFSFQLPLVVNGLGFTALKTTLLTCISGLVEVVSIFTGVKIVARFKNARAFVGIFYYIAAILGALLVILLPWSNKAGLLAGVYLNGTTATGTVILLSWLSNVTAGHTKRITVNAIMVSAYCAGSSISPQYWRAQYKPRNRIPWTIIGVGYIAVIIIILTLRIMMKRENARRDREAPDTTYDNMYIERVGADGEIFEVKVDKEFLDLTDKKNRDYRYVY